MAKGINDNRTSWIFLFLFIFLWTALFLSMTLEYDGSVFPGRLARRMSGKTSPAANCWCPRIAGPFFWSLHLFYFCLCGWSCLVLDDPWLVLLCLVSGCAPCFVLFCLAVPRFCLVPSSGPLAPQGLVYL